MARHPGFFDAETRLEGLSAAGDPLVRLAAVVDFELFRGELETALERSDRSKGGRPPYDAVLMFKVLVLQTLYTLSDDATEYQLKDRLSFMRFCGLALHDSVPDAKTIWLYREQLTRAGAIDRLFGRFDAILRERGFLAMGGQIVDATVIEARRPRLNRAEKETVKGGGVPEDWTPARTRQIDRDGRWTLKRGKKRSVSDDGGPKREATEIIVPAFGYKNHIGIDRAFGFIRRSIVTHAAAHDGGKLPALLDRHNLASGVWADTAYRSAANLERSVAKFAAVRRDVVRTRGRAGCRTSRGATSRARSLFLAGTELVKIGCAYHLPGPLPDWVLLNWFNFLDYDCQKYYRTGYQWDALFYTFTFIVAFIVEATLLFARHFLVIFAGRGA